MGHGQVVEDPASQELDPQAAVEALDPARGGGERGAVSRWAMPFAADTVEEHFDRPAGEPAGEHLAIVGQDLVGDAVGPRA